MRTRRPFPDVQEREPPTQIVLHPAQYAALETALMKHVEPPPPPPAMHASANRRQRRAGVATFSGPKELGPGLRRKLLEQRKARALGTLDVELRRLQRRKAKEHDEG